MYVLKAAALGYRYPDAKADTLSSFDLELRKGEMAILHAPNGSGKSTLLRLITGQLQPQSGSLEIVGLRLDQASASTVRTLRQSIGLVHHDLPLLDDRTVYENLVVALRLTGDRLAASHDRLIAATLERLDLEETAHLFPRQLSLGERQRVALARAVLREPQLLIVDEPFLQLDEDQRKLLADLLVREHLRGMAILILTTERNLEIPTEPLFRRELGS